LVQLEGAVYSVPSRWAGLDLVVRVGATIITVVGFHVVAYGGAVRIVGLDRR
jgi:hypothetical protein